MWNDRYNVDAYIYGTQPNTFLTQHAATLQSPVLSLAEGEGRNAVHLAKLGLHVTGVDLSDVGLAKARKLADAHDVALRTEVADLATYDLGLETWGSIVSISCHLPSAVRHDLYERIKRALRPGGVFLLESYTPEQAPRDTGGPSDPDWCVTLNALKDQFAGWSFDHAHELERDVTEGTYHTGLAHVVQLIARKPT